MKKLVSALTLVALLAVGQAAIAQKGNIKIAGSTTVLPLSQVWAEAYMGKNPGVSISVAGGGSGTGISMLLNGTCVIANSSRDAKPKEIATARDANKKLVGTKLAKDGLAIIVNPANDVKNLSISQLNALYSGKWDNWSQVGGANKRVVLVGRDTSSGTYGFFQEAVLGGKAYAKSMLSMPSNAAVAQAVAQSKDAIGYVGVAYADQFEKSGKVKILAVSKTQADAGIKPTDANVMSGKYPLFRYLMAYTIGSPSGVTGDFMKWCTGPEGQKLVGKAGYLPLN